VPVDMDCCRNELLAVSGEVSGIERMIFLFAKEENGRVVLSEMIRQSEYDRNPGRHLKFTTSIAWDSDYCWRLAIRSVASDDDSSCVHVYQLRHIAQFHHIISQYTQVVIIATVLVARLMIGIAVVASLILRFKRRTQAERTKIDTRRIELMRIHAYVEHFVDIAGWYARKE
jgi:hypothetical protein